MIIKKIDTDLSSFDIFSLFKDQRHCFFLDSSMIHDKLGRYSFIGFEPQITLKSKKGFVEARGKCHDNKLFADPFSELQGILDKYKAFYEGKLPFIGGAVGYLGYDMCHHLENLPRKALDDVQAPDCFFGVYDGVIVIDHFKGAVYAAAAGLLSDADEWAEYVEKTISAGKPGCFSLEVSAPKISLTPSMTKTEYMKSVDKIRDYIKSGEVYQVNMTQRFSGESSFSPYELYAHLRRINPAPFAFYMDFGEGQIISSSPERFVKIRGAKVQTRPIKGTRPRGKNPQQDAANRKELLESEKDRSELLMIVDLERNDLGRVCKAGSVKVPELFLLEEYATVYHLAATVEGELEEGVSAVDCLRAMFPGGSITGAPKIRAMEIIDELENFGRDIYTGSIGYIGFDGNADFNIAIRTILRIGDRVFFHSGGGIIWDSDGEMEYEEMLDKSRALIRALNAEIEE